LSFWLDFNALMRRDQFIVITSITGSNEVMLEDML